MTTSFLLDTSVASALEPSRAYHAASFIEWTRSRNDDIYLSAIALFEIAQGIAKLRRLGTHKRADDIEVWRGILIAAFSTRTLNVDPAVAEVAGYLSDDARARGQHPGIPDILIAATAKVHDLTLLTRNVRHFEPLGIEVIDPLVRLPD